MSELARRRSARDIWISRSHLYAVGAGAALAVLAAFGAGYGVGRGSVDLPAPPAQRLAGEPSDGALLELLARVDAVAVPGGGVDELTFPDALTGKGEGAETPGEGDASEASRSGLPGSVPAAPEAGDAPPRGKWTLAIESFADRSVADTKAEALRGSELEAWVGVERLNGEARFRVAVGGWYTESEADEALKELGLDAVVVPY